MIAFSDTSNYNGLVQFYENEIGVDYGTISGNTTRLKELTARINLALDRYFAIAIQASGTWELDDNNQTDYAVIYATITSGQGDYSFITDADGNNILDIYKVLILPNATSTIYLPITPVDEDQQENIAIINEANTAGVPTRYAKRGNAIQFNMIPNYTVAKGVKILINRTSSYFASSDTTKKPGYPYFQEYFFLKPAFEYARINSLASLPRLEEQIISLEGNALDGQIGLIEKAYGKREKDVRKVMTPKRIKYI